MSWEPISREEIIDEINASRDRMTIPQKKVWDAIRIIPEKWRQHPYGDEGGGFWVVGIIGRTALWYNDIEDGFNRSRYSKYGELEEYWCNQDRLEWTVQHLLDEINGTAITGQQLGPPEPIT